MFSDFLKNFEFYCQRIANGYEILLISYIINDNISNHIKYKEVQEIVELSTN